MPEGGSVLEFRRPNDKNNNCYYILAESSGLNYYYQNCAYIDRKKGNFFDVTVDIELLKENLAKIHSGNIR